MLYQLSYSRQSSWLLGHASCPGTLRYSFRIFLRHNLWFFGRDSMALFAFSILAECLIRYLIIIRTAAWWRGEDSNL